MGNPSLTSRLGRVIVGGVEGGIDAAGMTNAGK